MKNLYFAFAAFFPSLSCAFFCPTSFEQIEFGMNVDQVTMICGKPDTQKEYEKKNENIPQEWVYFIPQTGNVGYGQIAQATYKTSITFDDQGKAININVNGSGTGATAICGSNIQVGADKETIKKACGTPGFINKQTAEANPDLVESTKIIEFNYTNATPSTTLVFENGKLVEKK